MSKRKADTPPMVVAPIVINVEANVNQDTEPLPPSTATSGNSETVAVSSNDDRVQRLTPEERHRLDRWRARISERKEPSNPTERPDKDPQNTDSYGCSVGCGGCLGAVILSFITVPLLVFVLGLFGINTDNDIVKRAPLTEGATPTLFFCDEQPLIKDPQELNAAMRQFAQETGVAPFLCILKKGSPIYSAIAWSKGSSYGPQQPRRDGTYFTVVFSGGTRGGYDIDIDVGGKAKAVMDDQAIRAFERILQENYLKGDLTITEIFANTYRESAQEIMDQEVEEPYKGRRLTLAGIILAILISATICILLILRHNRKKREAERQEYIDKVIEMPLEKFGDPDAEELAKKYEQAP